MCFDYFSVISTAAWTVVLYAPHPLYFLCALIAAAIYVGRNCTVQCLSGTGGLRLGAALMGRYMKGAEIYIPNPTWGNHKAIFPQEGVVVKEYTYYDPGPDLP